MINGIQEKLYLRSFQMKLKPRSLQQEFDALLIHHSVRASGRPKLVLFKILLITTFPTKLSVQSHSNSLKNQKRYILIVDLEIFHQVRWYDVPSYLVNQLQQVTSCSRYSKRRTCEEKMFGLIKNLQEQCIVDMIIREAHYRSFYNIVKVPVFT